MAEHDEDTTSTLLGEIEQGPSKLDQFLEKNQKVLIALAILLVVVVAGYIVMRGLKENKLLESSGALAQAQGVDQYLEVAKTYANSPAGGTALILAANDFWEKENKEGAVKSLKTFLGEYPDHPAYVSSLINISGKLLAMDKKDEAKKYLQEAAALDEKPFSPLAEYLLAENLLQEGNVDKAVAAMEKVLKSTDEEDIGFRNWVQQGIDLSQSPVPTIVEAPPAPPQTNQDTALPETPEIKFEGLEDILKNAEAPTPNGE